MWIVIRYKYREDINSVLMTVMQGLLDKYSIDPAKVGRLEVTLSCERRAYVDNYTGNGAFRWRAQGARRI